MANPTFGATFKEAQTEPGNWRVYMYMQGETIPKYENHVRLSDTEKDPFGIPQLVTSVGYDENDELMLQDFFTQAKAMLEKAGVKNIEISDSEQAPGLDIHEMGGARMGTSPENSMVNEWNQLHLCKNVFVTDGACMTSASCVNPSLTYMALTARAAHFAVEALKKGEL